MPEGDTVLAAANQLHAALAGHTLVRAELRWPTAPPGALVGERVIEVGAFAKHMLTRFANGTTLRTHLRMEGRWRIVPTGSPSAAARSTSVRAVLATKDWTCVGTELGMLDLIETRAEPQLLGHLGPDILANAFIPTPALNLVRANPDGYLAPRLSREGLGRVSQEISDAGWIAGLTRYAAAPGDRPIGECLLDQELVSGIGTIFMAEGLFAQRISPWRPLTEVDVPRLLGAIRTHMIRGVVRPTTGRIIHVHGRVGRPCHRCGTVIACQDVGTPLRRRPAFYCPSCQAH